MWNKSVIVTKPEIESNKFLLFKKIQQIRQSGFGHYLGSNRSLVVSSKPKKNLKQMLFAFK